MPYNRKRNAARKPRRKAAARKPARLAPKTASAVKAIVKSQMSKVIEYKNADYAFEPSSLASMYHNTWYQFESDPFSMYQGTSDSEAVNPINRIGDSIFANYIHFKILFTSNIYRPNASVRIVILKCKASVTSPANISSHPQGLNNLINPIDREQLNCRQVMYDRVHTFSKGALSVSTGDTVSTMQLLWSHYLKIGKKVTYDDGASSTKGDTYRIFALPYDNQATSTSDQVARFSYFRRTSFQDA